MNHNVHGDIAIAIHRDALASAEQHRMVRAARSQARAVRLATRAARLHERAARLAGVSRAARA